MASVLHNKNTDEKRDALPLNGGLEFSFPPAAPGIARSPWASAAEPSRQASVDYLSTELGDHSLATCLTRSAFAGGNLSNKRSSSRREVEVNYAASNATPAGWRHLRSSTDPKGYTNPHQSRLYDSDHDMEQLLGLNSLHVPLEMRSISAEDQKSNTIRALADLFTCPLTSFPISVGLFCDEPSHGPNGTLTRLEGEIEALVQLQTQYKLNTNAALLYSPALLILLLAYVLGIFLSWQVGVLIGVLGLFIQFLFLDTEAT